MMKNRTQSAAVRILSYFTFFLEGTHSIEIKNIAAAAGELIITTIEDVALHGI
jgi:hypothetical protein